MTYDRCQAILDEIRRRQGTDRPFVQVRAGTAVVRGRVARSTTAHGEHHNPSSPYGVLVLESLGLGRGSPSFVQIASIPDDGLSAIDQPRSLSTERPPPSAIKPEGETVGPSRSP